MAQEAASLTCAYAVLSYTWMTRRLLAAMLTCAVMMFVTTYDETYSCFGMTCTICMIYMPLCGSYLRIENITLGKRFQDLPPLEVIEAVGVAARTDSG